MLGIGRGAGIEDSSPSIQIRYPPATANAPPVQYARLHSVLVFDVVNQMVMGKDFEFADQGEDELKGFDGAVRLFKVRSWGCKTSSSSDNAVCPRCGSDGQIPSPLLLGHGLLLR